MLFMYFATKGENLMWHQYGIQVEGSTFMSRRNSRQGLLHPDHRLAHPDAICCLNLSCCVYVCLGLGPLTQTT